MIVSEYELASKIVLERVMNFILEKFENLCKKLSIDM